ncbi:Acetyltransferase [Candidatus Zixiibacteriota bacterium]|nr:Acetyltransferase [candidate division Zixibacteria bacterium]
MDYLIRPLHESDYDDLIALWNRSGLSHRPQGRDSREKMAREFGREETAFIGMFDGDKMIGVVLATSDGRRGMINRLAIDPDYRGKGLAGQLIREGEDFLHRLGIKVIAALIEDENLPSISAFQKAGYKLHDDILYFSKRTSPED